MSVRTRMSPPRRMRTQQGVSQLFLNVILSDEGTHAHTFQRGKLEPKDLGFMCY